HKGLWTETTTQPFVTPEENVSYTVLVTNPETGCSLEQTTTIQLLQSCPEALIGVPNIFSPNNDGENDDLELKMSPAIPNIYFFRIYNRWGATVFETTDPSQGWNGEINGQPAPQGVYLYLLEAPCELTGGRIQKQGDITLLR
ncbi:MAG: gliding motility-associated C-terminal domain-containing protein, partial [Bacteroidota bacterium]